MKSAPFLRRLLPRLLPRCAGEEREAPRTWVPVITWTSRSFLILTLELRRRHLVKAALVCDAWRSDGVIVATVHDDERINGSSRLMEGGRPTWSLLRGASCTRAGKELSSEAAAAFSMFWMRRCSFPPVRVGSIWMSPARVMLLKQSVCSPECIIVVQLTWRGFQLCRC